jgi:hypothetical protein
VRWTVGTAGKRLPFRESIGSDHYPPRCGNDTDVKLMGGLQLKYAYQVFVVALHAHWQTKRRTLVGSSPGFQSSSRGR